MAVQITVVGLGPGDPGLLSTAALDALRRPQRLLVRTAASPMAELLQSLGLSFESLDSIYECSETLDQVYSRIAQTVLEAAQRGSVTYAVPGHPLVWEESVVRLLDLASPEGVAIEVIPSLSSLDVMLLRLPPGSVEGLRLADAQSALGVDPAAPTLWLQTDSRVRVGELKLALLERYPPDHAVTILQAVGVPGKERVDSVPLHQLDHREFDHLTSVFVPALPASQSVSFDELVGMMAHLRSPQGCPWDREQTHDTLRPYLLEECYEVLEAITEGSPEKLCGELGDLLLQVLFHAQLAAEEGSFRIEDVLRALRDKLRGRHAHVWGDTELSTPEEVLKSWEAIKRRERGSVEDSDSILAGVPLAQPALMRAQAITRRAARIGFDWPDLAGPLAKVVEETEELRALIAQPHAAPERLAEELGDLLIAVVNVARHLHTDAEQALTLALERWIQRFQHVERQARASGRRLEEMTLAELDHLWDEAKESYR